MEDSPRPDFRALFGGGNLLKGHGCGEDGGVGPTRVSYLHGDRAAGGTGVRATAAAAEECEAVAATVGSVTGGGAAASGGEDGLTRGL